MCFRDGRIFTGNAEKSDVQLTFDNASGLLKCLAQGFNKENLNISEGDENALQRLGEAKFPDLGVSV